MVYILFCYEGFKTIKSPFCTGSEEMYGIWVSEVEGPIQAELHYCPDFDEGSADSLPQNWDALPDHFTEIARTARFRDGRYNNPIGAPEELYPYLALALAYCRAILLRRNVCAFSLLEDDSAPVVDGAGSYGHDSRNDDSLTFREKTLDFYFGRRRDLWPSSPQNVKCSWVCRAGGLPICMQYICNGRGDSFN